MVCGRRRSNRSPTNPAAEPAPESRRRPRSCPGFRSHVPPQRSCGQRCRRWGQWPNYIPPRSRIQIMRSRRRVCCSNIGAIRYSIHPATAIGNPRLPTRNVSVLAHCGMSCVDVLVRSPSTRSRPPIRIIAREKAAHEGRHVTIWAETHRRPTQTPDHPATCSESPLRHSLARR